MTYDGVNSTGDARVESALREAAHKVMLRCDELATCTDRAGEITRLFCSAGMRSAHEIVKRWFAAAGLSSRVDAAGNLIGRQERSVALAAHNVDAATDAGSSRRPPALVIGSHLDTVADAGKYDGALGVLLGLAVAELATASAIELPFPLEVIGFSEEEGVRYQAPYFGSRAVAGDTPRDLLDRQDAAGVRLSDALRSFGGDPNRLDSAAHQPDQVLAYIEPHIEQGPILDQRELPVGAVVSVVGQSRAALQFTGEAGHAGTVPMSLRRDALAAAAEFIIAAEQLARTTDGLVATVGHMEVAPNVGNVIPRQVQLRVDLRHANDESRSAAFRTLVDSARAIAARRGVACDLLWEQQQDQVAFDAACVRALEQAIADCGLPLVTMSSGAGHDAVVMARRFDTVMLFVRCAGGVSHSPAESVREEDVYAALNVLWHFVKHLAATSPHATSLSSAHQK